VLWKNQRPAARLRTADIGELIAAARLVLNPIAVDVNLAIQEIPDYPAKQEIPEIRMESFTVTKLNKTPSEVLDAAHRRPVELTERGKRKYVLMAADHYDKMVKTADPRRAYSIHDLPPDIEDMLVTAIDRELAKPES
jgi:prevent-host-death family protein